MKITRTSGPVCCCGPSHPADYEEHDSQYRAVEGDAEEGHCFVSSAATFATITLAAASAWYLPSILPSSRSSATR